MNVFLSGPGVGSIVSVARRPLFGSLIVMMILVWISVQSPAQSIQLSDSQALRIGTRIWQNESGGTIAGLTAWNYGEDFASLGIGHFIWYPAGRRGPFEESFPLLVRYFKRNGVNIPDWLMNSCP